MEQRFSMHSDATDLWKRREEPAPPAYEPDLAESPVAPTRSPQRAGLQAYQESGRKDLKIAFGGAAKKEIVKKIMDGDPLIRADATYPPDVVATGVSVAVVGLRGRVYEGFYQKKLPLRMILPSELITKDNAKNYYVPSAAF